VRDKANLARGKARIEDYQYERARCMRADYERRRRAGEVGTLLVGRGAIRSRRSSSW
jgi:hypothetical protein